MTAGQPVSAADESPVVPAFEQMVIGGRLCRRGASGWWQWGLAADGMAWLPWEGPAEPPEPASRRGETVEPLSAKLAPWADGILSTGTLDVRSLREKIAALEAKLAAAEEWCAWWENEATEWAKAHDKLTDKLAAAERERDELRREDAEEPTP